MLILILRYISQLVEEEERHQLRAIEVRQGLMCSREKNEVLRSLRVFWFAVNYIKHLTRNCWWEIYYITRFIFTHYVCPKTGILMRKIADMHYMLKVIITVKYFFRRSLYDQLAK